MTTNGTANGRTDDAGKGGTELELAARRVDTALERAGLLDPSAQKVALALKTAVEEFHRAGLVTVVRRLKDDPDGRRLLFELVDDPGVYALLLMHGLVRADPATLAERALAQVRPYVESHGGSVELAEVAPPVIRVRFGGTCSGCSGSSATLRDVVEQALVTGVPGVERVEVAPAAREPALVPLGSVGLRAGVTPAVPVAPKGPVGAGGAAAKGGADGSDGSVVAAAGGGAGAAG
jgi:Fe-S cluster biogenesis protein NfuA